MQISHATYLQMPFEQHLKTINDYVTPSANNLEAQEEAGKKKGPTLCQTGPHFTPCQTKQ